jgi:Lrp/AsnC family leucine-responsive transcriptional regulator
MTPVMIPVHPIRIDETDRRILSILQSEGRLANARIAERVGLSPPTVLERIRKLEEKGVITGYTALVDEAKLGMRTMVYVAVSLSFHRAESIAEFREAILALPEVIECHHITGEDDFLLKVMVADVKDYEDFVIQKLTRVPGVSKLKSSIVLSTLKQDLHRLPAVDEES